MAKKKKISLSKEGFLWKGIPELMEEENKKLTKENKKLKDENENLKTISKERQEKIDEFGKTCERLKNNISSLLQSCDRYSRSIELYKEALKTSDNICMIYKKRCRKYITGLVIVFIAWLLAVIDVIILSF